MDRNQAVLKVHKLQEKHEKRLAKLDSKHRKRLAKAEQDLHKSLAKAEKKVRKAEKREARAGAAMARLRESAASAQTMGAAAN